MKRIAKVAAVGAAGLGLILGSSPAQAAAHAGVVAFVGTAVTAPPPPLPAPGAGVDGTWTLTSTVAVGANTEGGAGAAAIAAGGDLHVGIVNVFGTGAFTGLSGGSNGTGTVTIGSRVLRIADVGWPQSAATVIAFTGDTLVGAAGTQRGGGLAGVVSALPVPGNGTYTVVGVSGATYTV